MLRTVFPEAVLSYGSAMRALQAAMFCIVSLLGTMNAPAVAAVFGSDDRNSLPRNLRELAGSVGLVSSDKARTVCTGFCVGHRTVATAAHCLFRTAGERRPDLASFRFSVGARRDRQSSTITGRKTRSHRQYVVAGGSTLQVTPPIDATQDWALMRLDDPICHKRSLLVDNADPARIDRLAARGRLLHVAFHGDIGNWRLTASSSCATKTRISKDVRRQIARDFSDVSSLVLHECDTGLASSGSPLLALAPDNSLRVVAMNVGTYQQTRYLVSGKSVKRRYKPATVANTAVSGNAFADHVLAFTRANILDNQRSIRRLQIALTKAGFDSGPADGVYGERTRSALISFETMTGRAGIGLASQQLLRAVEQYKRRSY